MVWLRASIQNKLYYLWDKSMIKPADRHKVSFYTDTSAMKQIEVVPGSVTAPYTTGTASNTVTIAHGLGTSDVLWFCTGSVVGYEPYFVNVSTPMSIGASGRTSFRVEVDATNIYVIGTSSTAGSPQEAVTFNFKLFIVLP